MAKLLEEWKEDLVEALTEHDLLLGSKHQKIEHAVLLVRNIAVGRRWCCSSRRCCMRRWRRC